MTGSQRSDDPRHVRRYATGGANRGRPTGPGPGSATPRRARDSAHLLHLTHERSLPRHGCRQGIGIHLRRCRRRHRQPLHPGHKQGGTAKMNPIVAGGSRQEDHECEGSPRLSLSFRKSWYWLQGQHAKGGGRGGGGVGTKSQVPSL